MKRTLIITAGLCMCGLSAPTYAQNSQYENAILGKSMEARVGVTILFGGNGKSKKHKPQLALIGRRSHPNRASVDWAKKPGLLQNEYVETRLALTLSSQPELRLNGQEIYDFGGEKAGVSDGVKTAGKVTLAVGIIAISAVAVFLAALAVTHDSDD